MVAWVTPSLSTGHSWHFTLQQDCQKYAETFPESCHSVSTKVSWVIPECGLYPLSDWLQQPLKDIRGPWGWLPCFFTLHRTAATEENRDEVGASANVSIEEVHRQHPNVQMRWLDDSGVREGYSSLAPPSARVVGEPLPCNSRSEQNQSSF